METRSTVERFYDSYAETEWTRMDRHRMEFSTTCRAMDEFIRAGSTILDIGGGPGRYSIRLAQAGHRVTLLDLSAANVALARQKAAELNAPLVDFIHGNALDLSRFATASFDVVLLMGPLYHLLDQSARDQAMREAMRVLKPGGLLFASFITRYAILIDILKNSPEEIGRYGDVCSGIIETGVDIPATDDTGFTDAYFAYPPEIEPFMAAHGLTKLRLAAAEGIVTAVEQVINQLPDELFAKWADICYRLGTDALTWGTAEHMLYVGQKD